jgi:hypothetical protein
VTSMRDNGMSVTDSNDVTHNRLTFFSSKPLSFSLCVTTSPFVISLLKAHKANKGRSSPPNCHLENCTSGTAEMKPDFYTKISKA